MHVLGKVFTWLTVLAAVAAVVFSARTLAVRNSWTRQLQTLKAEDVQNTQALAEARQAESLRNQLELTILGWDRYWHDVDANPTAQGTMKMSVGINHGLGADGTPAPLVHAFVLNADGTSEYGGVFQATVQADRSGLAPAWRVREGEAQRWRPGEWRFRTLIPAADRARFIELETAFTAADQKLVAAQTNAAFQASLLEEAQANVQVRLNELNGDPQAPDPGSVPPEFSQGLIAAIEAEEAARDRVWAEVDRLQRARNRKYEAIQQLDAQNHALTTQLPQVPPTIGRREAGGGD